MILYSSKEKAKEQLDMLPKAIDYDKWSDYLVERFGDHMASGESVVTTDSILHEAKLQEQLAKHSHHAVFSILVDSATDKVVSYKIHNMENRYSRGKYHEKWQLNRKVNNTAGNETKWLTKFMDEDTYATLGLKKVYAVLPARVVYAIDKQYRIFPQKQPEFD